MSNLYDYKLAYTYNNTGGFVNIENLMFTAGDIYKDSAPSVVSNFSAGIRKRRADGLIHKSGFKKSAWILAPMALFLPQYFMDNFTADGVSGFVTVRTRIGRSGYANYNAILELPDPETLRKAKGSAYYEEYPMKFTKMVAI